MHRAPLLSLLDAYDPTEEERPALRQIFDFVRAEPRCFERSCAAGHMTGSAWILRHDRAAALLCHHRKLDRWLQPGGHADGDPELLRVAAREAEEESGIPGLRPLSRQIFDLDVHPIPARPGEPAHLHYDLRFCFLAPEGARFVLSEESKALAWVRPGELGRYTEEPSLRRLVRKWAPASGLD